MLIYFQIVSIDCTCAACLNGKCEEVDGKATCTCDAGFVLAGCGCAAAGKYLFVCVHSKKQEENLTTTSYKNIQNNF